MKLEVTRQVAANHIRSRIDRLTTEEMAEILQVLHPNDEFFVTIFGRRELDWKGVDDAELAKR